MGEVDQKYYGESGGLEGDGVGPRAGRSGLWRDIVKIGLDIDKIGVGRLGWLIEGDDVRGFGGGNRIG
ncbi:hypothetical protein Tco_0018346 [Tanacetum coccineum]